MLYKKGNILFETWKKNSWWDVWIYTGNVQKLTLTILSEQASYWLLFGIHDLT